MLEERQEYSLYLCFRADPNNPITGLLGSSNLTLAGLSNQGELNVDVLDHDATEKLASWFEDRWKNRWCVGITKELIQVIDESWVRPECPPPYHIYVKMAYHLAEEARAGLFQAIDEIYESPLTETARDLLNRELRAGLNDEKLVPLVLSLHEEDRLCIPKHNAEAREPRIICSLGIRKDDG